MMKLSNEIQKEILKFLFRSEKGEDLSDGLTTSYTKKIRDIVEKKGYTIEKNNANIRVMKNKDYSTVLEITTSGQDEKGRYIVLSMESFDGTPFKSLTIYDESWNELETIEV